MEFEEIKDKLTKPQYDFFYELKEYVELPIYFIGSILRYDYFKGYSDLDIIIFSPDIDSIKLKIKHFLNIDKKDRIIFLNINKQPISGYKFYYNDSFKGKKNIDFDLTIFKENVKKTLVDFKNQQHNVPFLCITYFLIIKILHYYIGIIDKNTYSTLKDFVWNTNKFGFNPIFMEYNEYKILYKKNYPNVKYMINPNL